MAESFIWGNLTRTTADPTLIDEAIGEAISAHNDDPDAHLGPEQALESHRAAEIIDHRAESVVNDKIVPQARRYVAIVDPLSEYDYATIEGALAYASSKGGGDIFIKRGIHQLSQDLNIPAGISLVGEGIDETIIVNSANRIITMGSYTNLTAEIEGYECGLAADDGATEVDTLTFPGDPIVLGDKFVDAADGTTYTVTDIFSENEIMLSPVPNYPVNAGFNMNRYYKSQILTDRTLVEFPNSWSDRYNQIIPGMVLVDIFGNIVGKIIDIPGDNIVKLAKAIPGSATFVRIVPEFHSTMKQELNGLTFDNSSNRLIIYQNAYIGDAELGLDITGCAFRGGKSYFEYLNDNNFYNTFTDCIIECDNINTSRHFKNTQFNRCIIRAVVGGSLLGGLSGDCVLRDCVFDENGKSSCNFLVISSGSCLLENCSFNATNDIDLQGAGVCHVKILSCRFLLSGARNLKIGSTTVIFSSNTATFGTTGNLITPSTAGKTIVANNIFNKTPNITTTKRMVATNIVT